MNADVSPPKVIVIVTLIICFETQRVMGCFGSVQNQIAALRSTLFTVAEKVAMMITNFQNS